jgi:hypothetical protein
MDITNEENTDTFTFIIIGLITLIIGYMIKYWEDDWQYNVDYVKMGEIIEKKIQDVSIKFPKPSQLNGSNALQYFLIGTCIRNKKFTEEQINSFLTPNNVKLIFANLEQSVIPIHQGAAQHMKKQGFFQKIQNIISSATSSTPTTNT